MKRRNLLQSMAGVGALLAIGIPATSTAAPTDGTPLQFTPKTPKDPNPRENELQKYPKCPYCGMDRTMFSHTRHLVHYEDDLVDGTCSLHCAAISLSLNIDRGPKAIYAGDYAGSDEIKPLVNVEEATYLIGSSQKGTMSGRSKLAYGQRRQAEAAQKEHGGELGDFDTALTAAYLDMAKDTMMIRKRRAERRAKMKNK
ncbi:nitrous oxide reductase accessory protein NosL [Thiohalomonas denitrificans]|uniref:nitrous oxide reductase accessory protein NosL n=1 Tax=Thiohalomonas denitrificans TaxID=415747 RepID=UPI0026EB400A|nr:nitrous oxide reductase accessory protein NosL [Thiohalomonas denitrificans]